MTRISRNPNLTDQRFLSPQQLYAQGGWSAIEEDTAKKAEILKAYGINAGLFPLPMFPLIRSPLSTTEPLAWMCVCRTCGSCFTETPRWVYLEAFSWLWQQS